ncbi:Oidioi.mRNA.OKI2018_I69.chr1.g1858.t1.cds [Oikopleura dioica]|uniref:Oidioi.mRNA.OKI2018_I69.chr1.g1858.t1.cds n=1 Tax=Oikopleura dioica TaxID=34765 RepID=A0ABN7SSP7_OIKDI|nr:Oidioi.mRNA.OKI2018_I69.chr1.g1858.t1.cds [Oikopleura dioica]
MVFAWPSLLLLLLLQSASAQGGPSELYGLKLDNWQVSETNLLAYQAVEDQIAGSLPVAINADSRVVLFGENLIGRKFVLTEYTGNEGPKCNDHGHTKSVAVNAYTEELDVGVININNTAFEDIAAGKYYFCFADPNDNDVYLHAGNNSIQSIHFVEVDSQTSILPVPLQTICIGLLLCLSGTFSGLNLGLMALDPQQLKILTTSGSPDEIKYAKSVLPVRIHGNFLLCTLLLGNVLEHEKAICSRHGLAVGYHTLPLTYIFMAITGIISYPLGKILDVVLGEEMGVNYKKQAFLELIKQGQNDLEEDEKIMIEGALKLSEKTVRDVMTPINHVFTVCEDEIIDYDFMGRVSDAGYSRIPVTKRGGKNSEITGLLFLRDLVMLDPDDNTVVSTVTNFYKHQLMSIDQDMKLDDMLEEFKKNHHHLSLVTMPIQTGTETDSKAERETCGIITLEDIIEEIICDEIVDETDQYRDNRSRIRNHKREKTENPKNFFRNHSEACDPSSNPQNPDNLEEITRAQIAAVLRFMVAEVKPFSQDVISENKLKLLLFQQHSVVYVKRSSETKPLLVRGQPVTQFIVIIEGKAEVQLGEDEMPIEVGPFRCFGVSALLDVKPTNLAENVQIQGSQSIPSGLAGERESVDRSGTPSQTGVISDATVRIISDEFIYARVTRAEYRQMRNQFEITKVQQLSASMEQLQSAGFSPENTSVTNVNETSMSDSNVKGKQY